MTTFLLRERNVYWILNNSISMIVAHNHPSGSLTPSNADIKTTQKLQEALRLWDIDLNDHLIFSPKGFYSMKEGGDL